MSAASLVLFAALGLSEESSSFARECCEHSFAAENAAAGERASARRELAAENAKVKALWTLLAWVLRETLCWLVAVRVAHRNPAKG